MTPKERVHPRRSARHVVRMPVQAVRERDFSLVGNVAVELSADGIRVRANRPVLTGERVLVSFVEPEAARWFDVEATVARVIHARRQGENDRGIALEFHSLTEAARATLRTALSRRTVRWARPTDASPST